MCCDAKQPSTASPLIISFFSLFTRECNRRASPDVPGGSVSADKHYEASDGVGGGGGGDEEQESGLPQDGVTALLKSIAQSGMKGEGEEHSEEAANAEAGWPATEEGEVVHTGGGEVKKKKNKKRKMIVAPAAPPSPAAPTPPSPLASFLRIANDTAVVDGVGEAPAKRKKEEAAAVAGGDASEISSTAAATSSIAEQPVEQLPPSEMLSGSPSKKIKTSTSAPAAATSGGADGGAAGRAASENATPPFSPPAPNDEENGSRRRVFAMQPRSVSRRSGFGRVAAAKEGRTEEGTGQPAAAAAAASALLAAPAGSTPEACSNAAKDSAAEAAAATSAAKVGGEEGKSTPLPAAERAAGVGAGDTGSETAVGAAARSGEVEAPAAERGAGWVTLGDDEAVAARGSGEGDGGGDGGAQEERKKKKKAEGRGEASKRKAAAGAGKSMNVVVFSNVEKVAGGWWGGGAKKPVSTVAYSAAGKLAPGAAPASSPTGGRERVAGGPIKKHSKIVIPVGTKAQDVGEKTGALREGPGGEAGRASKRPVSPGATVLRQRSGKPAAPVADIFARDDSPPPQPPQPLSPPQTSQPQPPGEEPASFSTGQVRWLLGALHEDVALAGASCCTPSEVCIYASTGTT